MQLAIQLLLVKSITVVYCLLIQVPKISDISVRNVAYISWIYIMPTLTLPDVAVRRNVAVSLRQNWKECSKT